MDISLVAFDDYATCDCGWSGASKVQARHKDEALTAASAWEVAGGQKGPVRPCFEFGQLTVGVFGGHEIRWTVRLCGV
jgi:hypothetical protein